MGNDREIDLSGPFINWRVAVTGGTSGLGLALVRELRRRGARVAFVAGPESAYINGANLTVDGGTNA